MVLPVAVRIGGLCVLCWCSDLPSVCRNARRQIGFWKKTSSAVVPFDQETLSNDRDEAGAHGFRSSGPAVETEVGWTGRRKSHTSRVAAEVSEETENLWGEMMLGGPGRDW